jgi:hypothetical protein
MIRFALLSILCCSATVCVCFDQKNPALTPEQQGAQKIEELKQKLTHDSERETCIHSAELVHDLVEQFNLQMNAGELQPAQRSLNDIAAYADKARQASMKSHHKLKQAELMIHKSARRLEEIEQSTAVENRPAVDVVVKKLDAVDDYLLDRVFKD